MKLLSYAFGNSIADFYLVYYLELLQAFAATVSQENSMDTSSITPYLVVVGW